MTLRSGRPGLAAALALLAALSAAGCGKSKERELYEKRQAACATLVSGTTTLVEARRALLATEFPFGCGNGLGRFDATDQCGGATTGPYQESVCQVQFIWPANDPALCDEFDCAYACEIRLNQADLDANGDGATLCLHFWIP